MALFVAVCHPLKYRYVEPGVTHATLEGER
jgi:hypothetical protein